MLNWLKRRAKVSFNNRYPSILRRSNSPEMFLTEQSMLNEQQSNAQNVKLLLFSVEGEEYVLDVPSEMTLNKVKQMAIGHFYSPLEAVGGSSSIDSIADGARSESWARYRLVLARDFRTLLDENSVMTEELVDNDEILLTECRKSDFDPPLIGHSQYVNQSLDDSPPTIEQIRRETIGVSFRNWDRQTDKERTTLDFKIAVRQILLTMIEASIHLIAPEDDAADIFVLVFEHLEKRHKPRVDKNCLKHLTEMGFSEPRAIKALQLKRNLVEAMEWLLDETNKQQMGSEAESDILLLPPERRKSFFMSGRDPAQKIMQEFNKYVEKWFVPDAKALKNLTSIGYGEDLAREALRLSCNNEKLADEFLKGDSDLGERGFERNSPIMSAILDSPIVQVALSKPKTLFALMVLCETPNNLNVWLSDPETHPVISQVLRIYHAEKHRLQTDSQRPAENDVPLEDAELSECGDSAAVSEERANSDVTSGSSTNQISRAEESASIKEPVSMECSNFSPPFSEEEGKTVIVTNMQGSHSPASDTSVTGNNNLQGKIVFQNHDNPDSSINKEETNLMEVDEVDDPFGVK